MVAHFRPVKKSSSKNKLNTREDKLYFAFRMYDLNGNDYISKEELLAVLTMMVSLFESQYLLGRSRVK